MAEPMDFVLSEVAAERQRQDAKWGEQNHDNFAWAAILGEEFGEACQQALWERFEKGEGNVRGELVQVAAVAVAWIECIDRRAAQMGVPDGGLPVRGITAP